MNRDNTSRSRGFTLIELMLAMTFISILLIAIALTVIQVGALYNKGMTLKETNQAARDVVADIQRTITSNADVDMTNGYMVVAPAPTDTGRLCLGNYSYIWNLGRATTANEIKMSSKRINLVKVPDQDRLYCQKNSSGALVNRNIRSADVDSAKELLPPGDHELRIHKFTVTEGGSGTKTDITEQQLYQVNFSIGTSDLKALTATQSACLPPNNVNSDINYCSVQDFSLVVRAGYRVN